MSITPVPGRPLRAGIALLASVASTAAVAQIAPSPVGPPERNILAWPAPDTLSPEAKTMMTAIGKMQTPAVWPPVAMQRRFADAAQASFGATLEKRYAVRIESTTIAGVPVRIVYPKGVTTLGKGPVLLDLHGGGFSLDSGSLTETIPIAALTGLPVVAVLYRLAPENPYPAAVDDALAVYQALERDHGANRIAVFGTSAGACLGAQLMARLTSLHRPMPAALGFFSGSADMGSSGDSESWMPLPNGGATLTAVVADYIGKTRKDDPILSPIHGDIARFPPTLLLSSTRDMLLSATAIFARALTEKGVDARLVVFDGLPHAFWAYMDIPETDQANALIARFLKDRVTTKR